MIEFSKERKNERINEKTNVLIHRTATDGHIKKAGK